ncbi:glycosyltransferase family 4 protein [Thomasclavelia spiroformis]|uniref:glycosyltransferase family 4 protein n=1 Tax=Thomasclavelia spiroformis TaxID=29348 RepID=UPI0026DCAA52|nr:glycosyltransferase family 4 protein [Thomasclavelia spiroformis]
MGSKLDKIIFVTQNLAPFRIDWLDELAKYFKIEIFYYNELDLKGKTNPKYMERKPCKAMYKRVQGKNPMIRVFRTFRHIIEIYDFNSMIILDGYGFVEQVFLIFLLQNKKIKYVITVDGILLNHHEKKIIYYLKKKLLNKAEFIFSTSKSTDEIIQYYGVNKKNIIRHIFTPLFQKDLITVKELENKKVWKEQLGYLDKFLVLSVGKIIESKGFDLNLELARRNPHLYFIIIGGKPTENFVKYIEENKINNVEFIDFCDKEKLSKFYVASDIFFHPTRTDVWGLVINEAMAHGLPIITTKKCVAGVSLVANGCSGFIVEVDDIDEMERKLNYFYKNPEEINKFGIKNLKIISENTIEKSTLKDYENLLAWRSKNG